MHAGRRRCAPAVSRCVVMMQLMELHDRPWFPKFLRDFVTDDLETILNFVNVYGRLRGALRNALRNAGTNRVVDLCSGGGGPWRWL